MKLSSSHRMALQPMALACLFLTSGAAISSVRAQIVSTNKWIIPIRQVDSSPAVGANGTVYSGSFSQGFWAVNSNGVSEWQFPCSEIKSSPAIGNDGTLYFGCRDHKFYALSPAGKLKWHFTTGGWVDSSPALAQDGTIYFGSWDKSFYALTPEGSLKWKVPAGGVIQSSPAVGWSGAIYFGSHDKKLYALAPDGGKAWEFATRGQIISSPALDGEGGIYFTSLDGGLYALDADGGLRWRLQTGGITESSPVLAEDGTIYLGVNRELWAVAGDGKKKWSRPAIAPVPSSPWVMNGLVYVVSPLYFLDAYDADGNQVWRFHAETSSTASPGVGPDGTIFLPAKYSNFYSLQSAEPLAKSPWPKFRGNARNTGNINDVLR